LKIRTLLKSPDVENPDDGSPLDESAHGLEPLSSEFGSSEAFDADPFGPCAFDANAKAGPATSAPTNGLDRLLCRQQYVTERRY
jgi:hypothetical protein